MENMVRKLNLNQSIQIIEKEIIKEDIIKKEIIMVMDSVPNKII